MSAADARNARPPTAPLANGTSADGTGGGASSGASGGAASRYEVIERLPDEGTLWVAYRARERSSGELRALKALKGTFARHGAFSRALFEAARPTLGWNHPHLARLHEVDWEDGTLFLAQEWLPGPALEARFKRGASGSGPATPAESAHILRHLASALEYLAARGEAHGDVRPRQILCAANAPGETRIATAQALSSRWALTDGGLSHAYAAANLSLPDVQSDAIYYLAPERCDGAPASPQADVYALGIVLFRLLTGRVPFDGPSPLAIARRHRSDAPPQPSQWNGRVSPELETLALQMLAKDPVARPSAADVMRALSPAATATPEPAPAAPGAVPVAPVAPPPVASSVAPLPVAPPKVPVADAAGLQNAAGLYDAQADAAVEKRDRKKFRRREAIGALLALFWTLFSAALMGGVVYGAYYVWLNSGPKTVSVPPYIGKSQAEAKAVLQRRGLTLTVRANRYDPRKPAGTVLSGDQPAGKKVKQGREVLVTVSQGPQPLKMVDFRELTVQRARQIVAREGLMLGQTAERYDEKIPRGYVCDQFPVPGELVRPTEPVSLVISKGPQPPPDNPDASTLPSIPGSSAVPQQNNPDPADLDPAITDAAPDVSLISRSVRVPVSVPADGQSHRVRIVVRDESGENTVYDERHKPGDTTSQVIRVRRRQGTVATVRVFLDDKLFREKRV